MVAHTDPTLGAARDQDDQRKTACTCILRRWRGKAHGAMDEIRNAPGGIDQSAGAVEILLTRREEREAFKVEIVPVRLRDGDMPIHPRKIRLIDASRLG